MVYRRIGGGPAAGYRTTLDPRTFGSLFESEVACVTISLGQRALPSFHSFCIIVNEQYSKGEIVELGVNGAELHKQWR